MSVLEIQNGYSAICEAKPEDAFKAYADFHHTVGEHNENLDLEQLQELVAAPNGSDRNAAWWASWQVRFGSITDKAPRYFRGSGIIVVGDGESSIQSVQYEDKGEQDPVVEKYGNYLPVAVRKAGLAVAVGRSMLKAETVSETACVGDLYMRIEKQLQSAGIDSNLQGHHLGYAVMRYGSTGLLVAGASGMLPSEETNVAIHERHPEIIARDKGVLYEWDGDAFAGFHDAVAAESVLSQMALSAEWRAGVCVVSRSVEDFPGANPH